MYRSTVFWIQFKLFVISSGFNISVSVLSLNLGWQFECCCCYTNVCNGVVWEDATMPTFGFSHMVLFEGWIWDCQMMLYVYLNSLVSLLSSILCRKAAMLNL